MVAVNQTSNAPTAKVTSATFWGAIAAIGAWADDKFWNDSIPGYVEAAIIVVVIFVSGYFTKNRVTDAPPAEGVVE